MSEATHTGCEASAVLSFSLWPRQGTGPAAHELRICAGARVYRWLVHTEVWTEQRLARPMRELEPTTELLSGPASDALDYGFVVVGRDDLHSQRRFAEGYRAGHLAVEFHGVQASGQFHLQRLSTGRWAMWRERRLELAS